jgi:4-hydroxyphenylacetate 3-monooxygenase
MAGRRASTPVAVKRSPSVAPFTADEYLESIRDNREVWIYGERVDDVTTHPAFRNGARMLARFYAALHDPRLRDVLMCAADTPAGGLTHRYFRLTRTADELTAAREAIIASVEISFGWMGRTPDYKAALLATLDKNAAFYHPYEDNARRWYREAQDRVLFFNHALVHPPIGRSRPPEQNADLFVHVVKKTRKGVIVRGAKVVSTGAVYTHYNFIGPAGLPIRDERFALAFIVPMNAKGVRIVCRPSYEYNAATAGTPFDYPLSSRLDENDSILILDDTLIPWDHVFICGDVERAAQFMPGAMFVPRAMLHSCTRLGVKLDFILGLVVEALAATGQDANSSLHVHIGQLVEWRDLVWAIGDAMVARPTPWQDAVLPNQQYALAYRVLAGEIYPKVRTLIEHAFASGLVYVNSSAADFRTPALRRYLDQYLRGVDDTTAVDRVKLMRALWDAIGTEFACRQDLYESVHGSAPDAARTQLFYTAAHDGTFDRGVAMVKRFMGEYDLDGWTVPDLINPDGTPGAKRRGRSRQ